MLPGGRIWVALQDAANRVMSNGLCGVILRDVVVECLVNARG